MSSKFQINLDRPSGVYYAGEVVTGTLTVNPQQDETCRSLQLEMIGKARVHWHTGSGDNRSDYDGRKTFLYHQRTLIGNFYRTALLDQAGESAKFGDAVGDGDLYIPCLPNEGNRMMIIVRLCDYDWGKRDDNLGEVIIDARDLASQNDAVTFDLTRNGKPEQGKITLAAKFLPNSTLATNENAHEGQNGGETLILKVLNAEGLRKADWFGQNDVYVQAWRAPSDLQIPPRAGKRLPEPSKKVTLPNGSTQFKFAFPTRADSPGSAVLCAGDYAYVAYYILAKIDKKMWRNPTMKAPVVILPSRPVPMPPLLAPVVDQVEPMPIYKAKLCCFTCGEAGNIEIKLSLPRRAFAPGETIDLNGSEVINDSTIPVEARVVIRQIILLTTTSGLAKREYTHRIEVDNTIVEPQTSSQLESLNITVPALPPSFFGARGLLANNKEVQPLTFSYELSLQAKAKSGHKVKIDMPILISALPPKAEAIRSMASTTSNIRIDTPFEIQSFAVCDDTPCATVTMTTGLEDIGEVVPAQTGAGNLWDAEEDQGNPVEAYSYQPQVVLFPSGVNENTNEEMVSQINTASVDHKVAYQELLASMDVEYDSRLAVDKWIKEYPSVAATLTSDEFASVLKKVLLSMEQGSVARELVSGLGDGVLTTNYIVAAMEACPFSKTTLVTIMAPYVVDPENKEIVLSKLYSYERKEVEKAFAM